MITREMVADDAILLGCEPAAILAVAEVESAGSGFLSDGRPAILFEAQWFHKFTGGQYDGSHPHISSPVWDRSLYRGGYAEYDRLNEAIGLDAEAALKSASWGAFQIMGFNFSMCGYASVDAFFSNEKRDENSQLLDFSQFIKSNPGLQQALRSKDWGTFARLYNGPGAVAQYSGKIGAAYQMHAKGYAPVQGLLPGADGPPIPDADPSGPPTGYVETDTGNVVRTNPRDSSIVKGANVGQVLTAGAGVATAAGGALSQARGMLGEMSDVGMICLTVLALAMIVAGFIYFRSVKNDRINMNRDGIA